MPAARSTSRQFALDETTARGSPSSRRRCRYATEPGYGWTPCSWIIRSTVSFFAADSPLTVRVPGGSCGAPSGRSMPREERNCRVPSSRGRPSTYRS